MIMNEVFKQFVTLLEERLLKRIYTTEDSIRYTLFYCLTNSGRFHPTDIILEYPHSRIPEKKVDLYIPGKDGSSDFVFEFKFDREIPSGKNSPRPQKAGKIFADLFRLALFKSGDHVKRFFLYVTDKEMAAYFQNPSNQLEEFFNLNPGNGLLIDRNYIERHSKTFINSSGIDGVDCQIVNQLKREIRPSFWVRIYEVKATNIS